jgi:hypothetical protein
MGRLGEPAREPGASRACFMAREKSEPARLVSLQLASWLVSRLNKNFLHKNHS